MASRRYILLHKVHVGNTCIRAFLEEEEEEAVQDSRLIFAEKNRK